MFASQWGLLKTLQVVLCCLMKKDVLFNLLCVLICFHFFLKVVFDFFCVSPWYDLHGRLGIKNQKSTSLSALLQQAFPEAMILNSMKILSHKGLHTHTHTHTKGQCDLGQLRLKGFHNLPSNKPLMWSCSALIHPQSYGDHNNDWRYSQKKGNWFDHC